MPRKKPEPEKDIDLGHGHTMRYFRWAPDNNKANREHYGVPLPRVPKAGAIITHPVFDKTEMEKYRRYRNGDECFSAIFFDLPEVRTMRPDGNFWTVDSWEPLTLSPSILCLICRDHGFIREGKWVPA